MRRSKWAALISGSILCSLITATIGAPLSFARTDLPGHMTTQIFDYTVMSGDSLSKIAEKFQTNVSLLSDLNQVPGNSLLQIGQTIKVIPYCSSQHANIYDVKTGDTIWNIAQNFHTTMNAIIPEQNKDDAGILKPGTRIFALQSDDHENNKDVISTLASPSDHLPTGEPVAYVKSMLCTLTAYGPGYESTGKNPGDKGYGITATGKVARENETIAVDPSIIPLGSLVYIEGIGYRQAQDTGGAIKGNHIDVFFADDHEALKFGVKKAIKVFLVK